MFAFIGAVSDGGSDVKWIIRSELGLPWEWCIPHMSHASTKWACAMVDNTQNSKNSNMTETFLRIKELFVKSAMPIHLVHCLNLSAR
uniref:Uncharacterized protein n=1 Tax=Globisporangium ultimum (strain ATCC 200006 / CBS 805.95 / DAOM BR144) TaxID=431595 RepID=K3WBD1_GLOUD